MKSLNKSIFIYGYHSVESQLKDNTKSIIRIISAVDHKQNKRMHNITKDLASNNIEHHTASKKQLDKITNEQKHQGIVAEITSPVFTDKNSLTEYISTITEPNLILILDSIQDPRNLGACLRSANAAGVHCVILNKDGSAPINGLVYKASTGALNKLKIFQVTNLARAINAIKKQNIWTIGLDGDAGNKSIYQINLTSSIAIVIGMEGSGLRRLTKQSCDELSAIPMHQNAQSLNLSVATGIALFEANRQRNTFNT